MRVIGLVHLPGGLGDCSVTAVLLDQGGNGRRRVALNPCAEIGVSLAHRRTVLLIGINIVRSIAGCRGFLTLIPSRVGWGTAGIASRGLCHMGLPFAPTRRQVWVAGS